MELRRRFQRSEKHGPLFVDGRWRRAAYAGPGTKTLDWMRDSVEPVCMVDAAAARHDLAYYYACDSQAIREADMHLLRTVAAIRRHRLDHPFNTALVASIVSVKIALADLNFVKPNIASSGVSAADRSFVDHMINRLSRYGL